MSSPVLEEVIKSTSKLSKTDLEYLQEWINKQPHLPQIDDIVLVPFLVRCDYSLERTKDVLDKYFTMRTHAPEFFKFRELDPIKNQLNYFHISPTVTDARGNLVVCMGFEAVDPNPTYDPILASFLALSCMEVLVRSRPATPGVIFVGNSRNLATGHITKLTVTLVKKFLTFLQEAAPMNILAIHVINLNPVVDKLMMLAKPFLSREIQNKIFFHSKNLDEFHKVVTKDTLPQDYSGTLQPARHYHDELVARLFEQEDWLRSLDRRVVDEGRRPGRAKGEGDVFGVDGSFKSLDFD